jgi:hypothetical protein
MDFASIALALALGFTAQRSYLCTVANVERFVVKKRADGLMGLVVAVCRSGVVGYVAMAASIALVMLPGKRRRS